MPPKLLGFSNLVIKKKQKIIKQKTKTEKLFEVFVLHIITEVFKGNFCPSTVDFQNFLQGIQCIHTSTVFIKEFLTNPISYDL